MMQPEIDVALEVVLSQTMVNITKCIVIKVRSNIEKEDATDESNWLVNDMADGSATKAQQKVLSGELRMTEPVIFIGTKAGCFCNGQLVTTGSLKQVVQKALYNVKLKYYLGTK